MKVSMQLDVADDSSKVYQKRYPYSGDPTIIPDPPSIITVSDAEFSKAEAMAAIPGGLDNIRTLRGNSDVNPKLITLVKESNPNMKIHFSIDNPRGAPESKEIKDEKDDKEGKSDPIPIG